MTYPSSVPRHDPLGEPGANIYPSPGFDISALADQSHVVLFYETDEHLESSAASHLASGLIAAQPAIMVASKEHRKAVEGQLQKIGFDIESLAESGRLVSLDAAETLDKITTEGMPDESLFRSHLGKLISEIAAGGTEPRVFGEMVALLSGEGNDAGALLLEQFWNRLAKDHGISLLCAYPMKSFGSASDSENFRSICEEHSEVLPTEAYMANVSLAEQRRAIVALQQKAKALETEIELRKSLEAQLQASQEDLRAFVESAQIGMHWVDPHGIIKWANAAEMNLVGYSADEYIGHHISEFHADQEVIEDILARLGRNERLTDYQARLRAKDGAIITVLISSSVLWRDGEAVHTQCFTRDISDQLRTQNMDQRLVAIVESSDDAIVSKDLNGVITTWNRGAQEIFGYTAEEAVGQPIYMLIPPGRHNEEPAILARIRAGQKVDHYETQRQRKDGTVIDISVTISPLRDAGGTIVGASKIARDITLQKRLQEQLEALTLELRQAKGQLEERVEERTASLREAVTQMEEFSYTVSHDLRAPLRAMNLYSQVLLEEFGPLLSERPEAIQYLQRISDNSLSLDRMVQDVLTFGQVAREKLVLEPVSLDELVANMIRHYPLLQADSAEVVVRPLGTVIGHVPSLSQVFSNLLVNAAKFVAPGQRPFIEITSERRGNAVRVWIKDNGIGIDPKFQHRLFGLFERLHPKLSYEGNGVGLAIVRKAIVRMNGTVGVESDGQSGSQFWFELPAALE